ncbi:hypothetical protein N7478_002552 [Penicillium angulare]|uniref:uncharacterized protein n=1 Tax=Penicillium angulare TaxID=116970 RepID=UPI0025424FDD|nr:uncharacterized protein N7478_002552 [Penicillium angulare]KAJ5286866.1 hypothetical protein N7478_002552 [Penicillium angulare]
MAIFDTDKRPRGLRVPSLTAMKNGAAASKSQLSFHSKKSNEGKTPESEVVPALPSAVPAPPPQRAPPPTKELPPPPKDQVPPPPRVLTKVPARREVGKNASSTAKSPASAQTPVTSPQAQVQPASFSAFPAPTASYLAASPPRASPPVASPQTQKRVPLPSPPSEPASPKPVRPTERPAFVAPQIQQPSPALTPPAALPSPPDRDTESLTPLEDFIPTPEESASPIDPILGSGQQASFQPPDMEPVAAPLNRVHYNCFQEHRNMPVAQNVWCPLPCQTCHKFDREIRHRCVFCCLRICESCYQMLQKCQHRSLPELMDKLP